MSAPGVPQVSAAQNVAPAAVPVAGSGCDEQQRERVRDAVSDNLRNLYVCGRAWSAWSHGTMSEDDFSPAEEDDDVIANITNAVMAAFVTQPQPTGPSEREKTISLMDQHSISVEVAKYDSESNKKAIKWIARIEPRPTATDESPRFIYAQHETIEGVVDAAIRALAQPGGAKT